MQRFIIYQLHNCWHYFDVTRPRQPAGPFINLDSCLASVSNAREGRKYVI